MNSILEKLEETASRFPNRIAVEDAEHHYTWKQLLENAKRVGSYLTQCGCQGRPVVLMMEKSSDAIAIMYGVLYSGGFYIFIDPQQPAERIKKMLITLDAKVIVAEPMYLEKIVEAEYGGYIVTTDTIQRGRMNTAVLKRIRQNIQSSDILYAVFTSGSTGEPKAITVSHDAAIRFITHFTEEFEITEKDVIGNQAPFDFDVSVKDIFSSCMTGAKLVLIPRTYFAMPRQLIDYLCERKVTTLIWAVSAMCMISQFKGFEYRVPVTLKTVMFSGEVMPLKQLKIWQDALPKTEFVNLYGPSEITCNCTFYRVPEHYKGDKLPIGISFKGRDVFLINDKMEKIVKTDQPGEIYVSGESIAEGYYRNPEKTAQSFVLIDGKRTYRTGDLGYLGNDGNWYFVGRQDSQIKHMGHRIELGEVETAMLRIKGIERACCLFDQLHGRIYGFYQGSIDGKDLRMKLKKIVPGYMVPNKLICVEAFELNTHGKIDRNVLRRQIGV